MTSLYSRIHDDEYVVCKLKPGESAKFSDGSVYKCKEDGSLVRTNKPEKLSKKQRRKRRKLTTTKE